VFGFVLSVSVLVGAYALTSQPVPVENLKTGVYKGLAQLTFRSFENGDRETAATLGQILERTWDQVEGDGERGLIKTNPKLFKEIECAMNAFTTPLIEYNVKPSESSAVESAYSAYLYKLKAADE
jgi:hypothetical protein